MTAGPDDGSPEPAWGDWFIYYAPDQRMPETGQPYATIVTKDHPGDEGSQLGDGRWRINIHVGAETFRALTGEEPRPARVARDLSLADVVVPHPLYGTLAWVSVVMPGPRTSATVLGLLREAHIAAKARAERRGGHA